jgi:hypothetical protein
MPNFHPRRASARETLHRAIIKRLSLQVPPEFAQRLRPPPSLLQRRGSSGSCVVGRKQGKNEDARDRSLWRLNSMNSQGIWTMHRPVQLCDEAASFLASCIFRLCRRWFFEFPRIPHPSALPANESPGCPESSFLLHRLSMSFQVSLNPASSGYNRRWFFEFPRIPHPSALPAVILRVSPSLRSSSSALR